MTTNINNPLTGEIITIVCDEWGIKRTDIVSHSRRRPLPWARYQLCEYLRRYAGHNTVSCAAMLHVKPNCTQNYDYRYQSLMRMYVPFREKDEAIRQRVKEAAARCVQEK